MTDTVNQTPTDLEAQIGAYADNLMITGLHAMEAITDQPRPHARPLRPARRAGRSRLPAALAAAAGIHPRYAQEWLEQQAAAGLIDVVADGSTDRADRTYTLSARRGRSA